MGVRLKDIANFTVDLVASGNKLLTTTTGNLTRLVSWSDFADWVIKTYAGFTQSGIGTGTPTARAVQAKLRELKTSEDFTGAAAGLTGFGANVFAANTTGDKCTAIGYAVLASNTSGQYNTAMGYQALNLNTSGYGNTAVGFQALAVNTTGGSSTFGGNTAIGAASMISNTTGDNNTAVGLDSLYSNTTGYSNVAVGSNAIGYATNGYQNVAVGWQAMFTGGGLRSIGNSNTAVGTKALWTATGSGNVAIGAFAGYYETGSNAFYVDNQDRTNTAGDKAKALLYGTFNAAASSQTLTVNAVITPTYGIVSTDIGVSGTQDIISISGQAANSGPLFIAQNSARNAYKPFTLYSSSVVWGQGATQATLNTVAMRVGQDTAIPAGGSTVGYTFTSTANFGVFCGSGVPSLSVAKGSLYLRSDGTTTNNRAYINTDGGTTWTALTTAA